MTVVPEIAGHLRRLLEFVEADTEQRAAAPLLRTSPYYYWLTYTLVRRELFEFVKDRGGAPDRVFNGLIDAWKELKSWGLDPRLLRGVIHECLYWLASLKALATVQRPFLVAPVQEGIPAIRATSMPKGEKLHFRGDFVVLWTGEDRANVAVVDVKADFGSALEDKYLRKTAKTYADMRIPFYLASPRVLMSNFDQMRERQYLLNVDEWWDHRRYPLDWKTGAYPPPEPIPWRPRGPS